MILVVGTFRLPVASREAARSAMERIVALSRAEPGCIDYAYAEDVSELGVFRVSEAWESREALSAHFEAAHMAAWRREREDLGLCDRDMRAYEVGKTEAL